MSVVVKRVGGEDYGRWLKVQVGGASGAGKTRLASTFPSPLYLATDPSLDSVLDRAPAYIDVQTSDQMIEVLTILRQGKAMQEKYLGLVAETVVLDTADDLQQVFMRERMAETHKDTLTLPDYGWLRDQMRELIRNFRNLPMHVVVTHHLKDEKDEESGKVSVLPGLVGQFAEQMSAMFSLSLFLRTEQTTKVIDGKSSRVEIKVCQTAGDGRHAWVKDRFHVLPTPDYESDLTTDFDRIYKAVFGRDLPAGAVLASTVGVEAPPQKTSSVDDSARAAATRKKTSSSKAAAKDDGKLPEAPPEAPAEQPAEPPPAPEPESKPETKPPAPEPAPEAAQETQAEAGQGEPEPDDDAARPLNAEEPALEADGPAEPEGEQVEAAEPTEEESVPVAGTPDAPAGDDEVEPKLSMVCTTGGPNNTPGCGGPIAKVDDRDLSWLRFRTTLCRSCFLKARGK